jgi:Protein of unknown function (DUF726)
VAARSVVSGRFINGYSVNDVWTLGLVFKAHSSNSVVHQAAGLWQVGPSAHRSLLLLPAMSRGMHQLQHGQVGQVTTRTAIPPVMSAGGGAWSGECQPVCPGGQPR